MSEYKWSAEAFDALRIIAANGEFEIVGGDTNEIELQVDEPARRHRGSEPHVVGRWLELHPFGGGSDWALTLPNSKAWVVEVMSGSGEVNIENVHARVTVQLGSGDIHLENCRGVFHVHSGNGDVKIENCVQADVPAAPERVAEAEPIADAPPVPPTPGIPPIPPFPPLGLKVKLGKKIHVDNPEHWEAYGQQWEEWGERFAEQAARWAEKFSREFGVMFNFGVDDQERADGIHVRVGSGDVHLEEIDAQLVTIRNGNGDAQIELGRIAELDVETSRGDVEIESVLPTSAWELVTRHGDIHLTLPGDAYARIDAATRHGEIECDAPLVRVGRPGPGARHGGRMVGTVGDPSSAFVNERRSGQGGAEPVDIHLESLHGDIEIEFAQRASRYAGQAAPQTQTSRPAPTTAVQTKERTGTAIAAAPNAVVPVTVTDLPPNSPGAELPPPPKARVQVYDSQLAILQALQKGEISVAEAEMLLASLKS